MMIPRLAEALASHSSFQERHRGRDAENGLQLLATGPRLALYASVQ